MKFLYNEGKEKGREIQKLLKKKISLIRKNTFVSLLYIMLCIASI